MNLVRATIVLAAFAALLAVAPFASASPELTHPTGTRVSAGTLVELTNVAHSTTAAPLTLTTSLGNISCASATITGTITKNTGTEAQVELTTTEFGGTPGKTTSGHCQGIGAEKLTLTPSHTSDETKSLPWCITNVGTKDQFSIRGGKCGEAPRPLTFSTHGDITCSYERAEIVGTYTTHPSDAIATVTGQEFKRFAGSAFCPSSGQLDMALTMFTHGKPTEPVYIS